MIDKDLLRRQIKTVAQESWSNEMCTTVNAVVEYIVNGAFEKLLEHLEPLLRDPIHVNNEIEDLKVKLRYINREIETIFTEIDSCDDKIEGLKNGKNTKNAERSEKAKGNASKSNPNEANVSTGNE